MHSEEDGKWFKAKNVKNEKAGAECSVAMQVKRKKKKVKKKLKKKNWKKKIKYIKI